MLLRGLRAAWERFDGDVIILSILWQKVTFQITGNIPIPDLSRRNQHKLILKTVIFCQISRISEMFWIRADHLLDTTSNSDIIVVVTPNVNRLEGGEKGSARNVPQPSKMRWKQRRSTMQVMWNQKSSGKGEGNASHCDFSIDIQCIKHVRAASEPIQLGGSIPQNLGY